MAGSEGGQSGGEGTVVYTETPPGRRPKGGMHREGARSDTVGAAERGYLKQKGAPGQPAFMEVYKRGQGRYTRLGTALGAAVLILAGANYLYSQMVNLPWADASWFLYVRVGVALAAMAGFGLLTYWLAFVRRGSGDFLIATEGEMKKVNWSSRREVVGSTKVVIVSVILLSALLFVVDLLFIFFFSAIGVLKTDILRRLFAPQP